MLSAVICGSRKALRKASIVYLGVVGGRLCGLPPTCSVRSFTSPFAEMGRLCFTVAFEPILCSLRVMLLCHDILQMAPQALPDACIKIAT